MSQNKTIIMCEVCTTRGLVLCSDLEQACMVSKCLKEHGEISAHIRGKYRVIIEENN